MSANQTRTVVGVISDTHGLMRPEALDTLRGSHLILHAGDVGTSAVMDSLAAIAPVIVVRGNVDRERWAATLPETAAVEIGKTSVYMLHDLSRLDMKPEAGGFSAVIFGHSHQPVSEMRNGVLYFNPGSAGPRRFKLPISVGRLLVEGARITGELIKLSR
jgi:uncharacterized protein